MKYTNIIKMGVSTLKAKLAGDANPFPVCIQDPIHEIGLEPDPIDMSGRFVLDDIALIAETYKSAGHASNKLDDWRHKHLVLPDWFKTNLDPLSEEYFEQQMRLWNVIAGVDRQYTAGVDEAEIPIANVDAVRLPGFYMWRGAGTIQTASHHEIGRASCRERV